MAGLDPTVCTHLSASLPGLTRQSIFLERVFANRMDARAFAAPKRLRPRRRVKPAHDEILSWVRSRFCEASRHEDAARCIAPGKRRLVSRGAAFLTAPRSPPRRVTP